MRVKERPESYEAVFFKEKNPENRDEVLKFMGENFSNIWQVVWQPELRDVLGAVLQTECIRVLVDDDPERYTIRPERWIIVKKPRFHTRGEFPASLVVHDQGTFTALYEEVEI